MKKLLTLGLAAGLVMAASAPASAIDVKMDGMFNYQYVWSQSFAGNNTNNWQWQVARVGANFTASEALSGYFQLDAKWSWGNANDTDNSAGLVPGRTGLGHHPNANVRLAYIDWLVPGTPVKIRMGRQEVAPPAVAMGKNPALWWSDPADGIAASAKVTDWLSLNAWWARYGRLASTAAPSINGYNPVTGLYTGGTNAFNTHDSITADVFFVGANAKFDGFQIQPWVAYGAIDRGSLAGANGVKNNIAAAGLGNDTWFVGVSGALTMFDPLTVKADFIYGDRDWRHGLPSQHGWFLDGAVSYKTPYGTPALSAWYGSGDKKSSYGYQRNMPSIGGRTAASNGFFNGTPMNDNLMAQADGNVHSLAGTWGVKLGMDGISFLQDLSHSIAVIYAQGTNDARSGGAALHPWNYLTEKDSFVEFDFTTTYKIYKNLSAVFAVAYVVEDFDGGTNARKAANGGDKVSYDNGWGLGMQIQYKF